MTAIAELTSAQLAKAAGYHRDGMTWSRIAVRFGTSAHAIRSVLDHRYREQLSENRRQRALRDRLQQGPTIRHEVDRETAADRRVIAMVPEDTRSMQARFFGDPLPGRSALDQRQAAIDHPVSFPRYLHTQTQPP